MVQKKNNLMIIGIIAVLLYVVSQMQVDTQAVISPIVDPNSIVSVLGEIDVLVTKTSFALQPYKLHYQIRKNACVTGDIVLDGTKVLTQAQKDSLLRELSTEPSRKDIVMYSLDFKAPSPPGDYCYEAVVEDAGGRRVIETGTDIIRSNFLRPGQHVFVVESTGTCQ